jgi:hypothetical protein
MSEIPGISGNFREISGISGVSGPRQPGKYDKINCFKRKYALFTPLYTTPEFIKFGHFGNFTML